MSTTIVTPVKTKILLTLTQEQKEIITALAKSKGLSLSSFLRLKALEEVTTIPQNLPGNTSKIASYLEKKLQIPKKFKEYESFKDFHKENYKP